MEKLTDITYIKSLLAIFADSGSAKKRFGQNFLTSEHVLQQIINAAEITDQDTIVEIGPGLGVLTHELTQRAKKVITIEMDHEMVSILKKTLAREPTAKNLTILEQDALRFNISADPTLNHEPYKLVANLPYNVATPLLKKFLVDAIPTNSQPTRIVVLVQKEVAEKACAKPGDHNVLSLTLQPFGTASIIASVPPSSFYPSPKVTSSILLITPYETPLLPENLTKSYFRFIHAAFSQKRKMLGKSLQQIVPKEAIRELLSKANIPPEIRPQELTIDHWLTIASHYSI